MSARLKGNGLTLESMAPADMGGVAVIVLGKMIVAACWAGDIGLALRGVSGRLAVKGVAIRRLFLSSEARSVSSLRGCLTLIAVMGVACTGVDRSMAVT